MQITILRKGKLNKITEKNNTCVIVDALTASVEVITIVIHDIAKKCDSFEYILKLKWRLSRSKLRIINQND